MRRNGKLLCAALLAVLALACSYTAVSAAAGSSDPLVTLSYLTEKFAPQMEQKMVELVDAKAEELTGQFRQIAASTAPGQSSGGGSEAPAVFTVVTLSKGQVLTGDIGCEVMLRVGTATCSSSGTTGLIDTTSGTVLGNGGALVTNHLYMVTIQTRSVVAQANTVKLLVRGPYTIA